MPQTKSVKYWTFAFNRMYHLKFNYQIFNEVESSSVDIDRINASKKCAIGGHEESFCCTSEEFPSMTQ
jgi:hypothetical protein